MHGGIFQAHAGDVDAALGFSLIVRSSHGLVSILYVRVEFLLCSMYHVQQAFCSMPRMVVATGNEKGKSVAQNEPWECSILSPLLATTLTH